MSIANLFSLLTGMVLFLYGMSIMGDALKRAAGSQLEMVLAKLTSTTFKSVTLGAGVTAVMQSSSATSVMAIGFVNSGVMKVRQAIGIILGAILGTSITGWIIALSSIGGGSGWLALFSTTTITGIIAVAGIVLHSFVKKRSNLGDILLGFVVLMVGIETMSASVAPLSESEAFISTLTMFSNPFLGVLAGALFTAILQSASAAVGILQALCVTGAIDFATAFPLLMGISIGASFPVMLASLGATIDGKRTALAYLLISVFGAVIVGGLFYLLNAFFVFPVMTAPMSAVSVAMVNTLFRLANVLVLMPFIGGIEKLCTALVKDRNPEEESGMLETMVLEDRFIPYPPLAIMNVQKAINDLAFSVKDSVELTFKQLSAINDAEIEKIRQFEDLGDRYDEEIGVYLMKVSQNELSADENAKVFKYLHCLTDFERISDYSVQISILLKENQEKNGAYPEEVVMELTRIQNAVLEMVSLMVEAFTEENTSPDGRFAALAMVVSSLSRKMDKDQVLRVQQGTMTMAQSSNVSELVSDYGHIATHCSKIVIAFTEIQPENYRLHVSDQSLDYKNTPAYALISEYRDKYGLGNEEAG